jgi:hypothetical protein
MLMEHRTLGVRIAVKVRSATHRAFPGALLVCPRYSNPTLTCMRLSCSCLCGPGRAQARCRRYPTTHATRRRASSSSLT